MEYNYPQQFTQTIHYISQISTRLLSSIPGSNILYKYIKSSHQNDPLRTILELFLLIFLVWYFLSKKSRPEDQSNIKLTEKEVQELIDEWEPEPLVAPLSQLEKSELEKLPVVYGSAGLKFKLADGKEKLNFSSFNFLGVMNSDAIKEKSISALRKYGVGSCGPPGFYGTIDVHIELENNLAKFLNVESSIIYSQGFSCISSAIPAFAKRGDVIIADEGVGFAVQKGLQISRSTIHFFKHNDMIHLEKLLSDLQADEIKKKRKLTRKFIVVEGLYLNSGDICPLPRLIELKNKFKYRLIVEESLSFGVLGKRGAGITDHFGIEPKNVDIFTSSLSNSLGAAGGFCAGTAQIVDHQRLSGQAYTFSASLPAILAVAAIESLKVLESDYSTLLARLRENIILMRSILTQIDSRLIVSGGLDHCPVFHMRLLNRGASREDEEKILQEIVDLALKDGVVISRAKYINEQEYKVPEPSIRLCVSAGHLKKDVERAGQIIKECARKTIRKI